jgi:transposase-like protein
MLAARFRNLSQIFVYELFGGTISLCDPGQERGRTRMMTFKAAHFVTDIILTCVRWYVAYPLSYRQVEELMQERGVAVDHATINRWVLKYSPQLVAAFHRRKRPVWHSWWMDETYIKVKGQWYYLYRAVDKTGQTIDFLLTEHRDEHGQAFPRQGHSPPWCAGEGDN